jgi:dihydrofolate synthase/folylpolyglutamate synthase
MIFDYEQAVAYLDRHIGAGVKPGLGRIRGLLDLMGNPEEGYPLIHVAGTNGKTSVSRMATMVLVGHGLTTGTFTSPHLERIEERFSVNGYDADAEQFAQALTDVAVFADIYEERYEPLTYFELSAAAAFAFFAEQAVEAAVVEVGLGGRLDATNVAHGNVAVLTGVGLEHTEFLGETVELIAREKLAILEPGAALVTGPLVPEVDRIARTVAEEQGSEHYRYGYDFRVDDATRAVGGWDITIEGIHGRYEDLYLPIHGRHQTINLAVAIAATEALLNRELDDAGLVDAVSVIRTPGRMEPIATDPVILLDGAHNPDAFRALGVSLSEEFPTTKWVLVFGAMIDKNIDDMIPALAPRLAAVITTSVESTRAFEPDDLAARVGELVDVHVEAAASVSHALERARELVEDDDGILVAGSLYLAGAVRSLVLGDGTVDRNERSG